MAVCRCRRGQPDLNPRSLPRRTVDGDAAAGLPNETVDHAETQPAAFAGGLGGKEGLEDPLGQFRAHAAAGVADCDLDGAVREAGRGEADSSLALHGVTGIDRQIHQGVFQLAGVDAHRRQRGFQNREAVVHGVEGGEQQVGSD